MSNMNEIWTAVCSGDTEYVKKYFSSTDAVLNRRYSRFGSNHSLIMGAARNGQYEMIRLLMSFGEKIEEYEETEYKKLIQPLKEQYYAPEIEKLKGKPLRLNYTVTSPNYPGFKGRAKVGDDAYYELCEWLRRNPDAGRVEV